MSKYPYQNIARILRADQDTIKQVEERLGAETGKKNVIEQIIEKNETVMVDRLERLGLNRGSKAGEIYDALIKKMAKDDVALMHAFNPIGKPDGYEHIAATAKSLAGNPRGFFLRREKAKELLRNEPPQNVINALGYDGVEKLLEKEDLFEIFSALRFLEGSEWLNTVFFKQYEELTPEDFEEREIVVKPLSIQWANAAQDFIKKKYHNISHLKELGVIFIIPIPLGIPGELIRNFSLLLHYLHEVPFYSHLFRDAAKQSATFTRDLTSLLRGDVIDERLPKSEKSQWMVIQRYLAKDDENDWRLFEPHIDPEALHWARAERKLVSTGEFLGSDELDLSFWDNLGWVGDYYHSESGIDILVSFNLVDTAMSLVKEKELIKYLYHHQESLWNKIFAEYFGEEKMEDYMRQNLLKGWFEV